MIFSSIPSRNFYLRLLEDSESAAFSLSGVHVALNERADTALLDLFLVGSRLYATRLISSCKVNSHSSSRGTTFVVSTYALADFNPDGVLSKVARSLWRQSGVIS